MSHEEETPLAAELTEKDLENPDSAAMSFLRGLFGFLSDDGYEITTDVMEEFITMAAGAGTLTFEKLESLLRPLVVKNGREDADFHKSVLAFTDGTLEHRKEVGHRTETLDELTKECERMRAKKDSLAKKAQKAKNTEQYITDAEYTKLKNASGRDGFLKLAEECPKNTADFLKNMNEYAAGRKRFRRQDAENAVPELQDMMKKSIFLPDNAENVLRYAAKETELAERMTIGAETEKKKAETEFRKAKADLAEAEQKLEEETAEYKTAMRDVYKSQSFIHREKFIEGGNAVHCEGPGEYRTITKPFGALHPDEEKKIADYIRRHRSEFLSRFSRYVNGNGKHEIDIMEMCRNALKTGGVPLKPAWKKPVRKRARILLMLDISGSCSAASALMLTFMYYMKECVPGGCLAYVFVERLYDVSDILDSAGSPEEAVERIIGKPGEKGAVPTGGAYSNYGKVFREFCEKDIAKLNSSRTYTFIIGDARNNNNDPETECFKKICRKSARSFWLNTERKEKWNTGDSVIGTYAEYVDVHRETRTPADMLEVFGTLG